jgi:hypothetical protein
LDAKSEKHDGPLLQLSVEQAGGWTITISVSDGSGQRRLGYEASGSEILGAAPADYDLRVRDENRDVWTTMPINHRSDIRNSIDNLLTAVIHLLKDGGHKNP